MLGLPQIRGKSMSVSRRKLLAFALLSSCVFPVLSANSSETINYIYDARGRLVQVGRSGRVNDGIQASYSYDRGDNRTNVTVTGPGFLVNDVTAIEGSALVFTVVRTGGSASTATVSFLTSNGTAVAGSDYDAASGNLTFDPGVTTRTVSVTTIDDASIEVAETVNVTLSNPTGATISDAQGVGTITNNDEAPPSFALWLDVMNATEGDPRCSQGTLD